MNTQENIYIVMQIDCQKWDQWNSNESWDFFFKDISQKVCNYFSIIKPIEISILLTDDHNIQLLNQTYRSKDSPTNVLSFPQTDLDTLKNEKSFDDPELLGDIVLSVETILQEAEAQNKLFMNHVIHLFIHSLLHLLGFTHNEDDDTLKMETLEIQFLNDLGIQNPYQ